MLEEAVVVVDEELFLDLWYNELDFVILICHLQLGIVLDSLLWGRIHRNITVRGEFKYHHPRRW